MKKVKLKFFFELAKVLLALALGAGGMFTTFLPDAVTLPNKDLLMATLVILITILLFGLLFVFLFIHNKIK